MQRYAVLMLVICHWSGQELLHSLAVFKTVPVAVGQAVEVSG